MLLLVSELGNLHFSSTDSANLHSLPFFPQPLHIAGFNRDVEKSEKAKETRAANECEALVWVGTDDNTACGLPRIQFMTLPLILLVSASSVEIILRD